MSKNLSKFENQCPFLPVGTLQGLIRPSQRVGRGGEDEAQVTPWSSAWSVKLWVDNQEGRHHLGYRRSFGAEGTKKKGVNVSLPLKISFPGSWHSCPFTLALSLPRHAYTCRNFLVQLLINICNKISECSLTFEIIVFEVQTLKYIRVYSHNIEKYFVMYRDCTFSRLTDNTVKIQIFLTSVFNIQVKNFVWLVFIRISPVKSFFFIFV